MVFIGASDIEYKGADSTLLHVLKLAFNGSSFRSSDIVSMNRALDKRMFSDSKRADIQCGRTKMACLCEHAIAPWVKNEAKDEYNAQPFGIHTDETTWISKFRLVLLVTFFKDKKVHRYLSTVDLEVEFDLKRVLHCC